MTAALEFRLAMMVPTWSKPEEEGGGQEERERPFKVPCSRKVCQSNLEVLIFHAHMVLQKTVHVSAFRRYHNKKG